MCLVGFTAAIVDSIAGGGGVITLPAYLAFGIPPQMSLGTNKFSGTASSLTSSLNYFRFGKINMSLLKYLIPFSLIGSALGVFTVLRIHQNTLRIVMIILIFFVGIYSLLSRRLGQKDHYKGYTLKTLLSGMFLAFSLGFYDGFFGPGTGSFLIFGLLKIYHFDFLNASGNSKMLNFISNITSLTLFAINGKIIYLYAIPVSIFMIFGAISGSKIAYKKGSRIIKPIFILMSLAVAIKLLFDLRR